MRSSRGVAALVLGIATSCGGKIETAPERADASAVGDAGEENAQGVDGSDCTCADMKSLDCYCKALWCESYENATSCQKYGVVFLEQGCGYEFVHIGYENVGFGWGVFVFDASSHALVAASTDQESPMGPCKSHSYETAGFPKCPTASYCRLCGPDDGTPPCVGVPGG